MTCEAGNAISITAAAEQAVAVDRLAAREIGAILCIGIHHNPKLVGVGKGRKAATEPQAVRHPWRGKRHAFS